MRFRVWVAFAAPRCTAFGPNLASLSRRSSLRMGSACPALDAIEAVKMGQTSAEELVARSLDRIGATDEALGAFLSVQGPSALAAARDIDAQVKLRNPGALRLPLLGLPIAVKDNLCTQSVVTTAASNILKGYAPSYDATAVRRLREAGAIIIGKTNMDEFAMGSTTETSAFRTTRNPRNSAHAPGGSSGGSAAAVAAGQVLVALGTDTGGSVRQPAAWCGVVGLKPTYGRVSRSGLIAYASSTDCIGPIASSVQDAAAILSVIAGADPGRDSTSLPTEVPDYVALLREDSNVATGASRPLEGLRIGVIAEALGEAVQQEVAAAIKDAVDVLTNLGASTEMISLPQLRQQCAAYYVNVLSEASANLARFDGIRYGYRDPAAASAREAMTRSRREGFGDEVRQRIILGTFSLSTGYSDAYYKKAQAIRAMLRRDFDEAFQKVDVLVCATAPTTAYRLGEFAQKGVASYADDLFTVPASLGGLPAISLPCGVSADGLPIGLQIIGAALQEATILRAAYAYERATEWRERWRPLDGATRESSASAALNAVTL